MVGSYAVQPWNTSLSTAAAPACWPQNRAGGRPHIRSAAEICRVLFIWNHTVGRAGEVCIHRDKTPQTRMIRQCPAGSASFEHLNGVPTKGLPRKNSATQRPRYGTKSNTSRVAIRLANRRQSAVVFEQRTRPQRRAFGFGREPWVTFHAAARIQLREQLKKVSPIHVWHVIGARFVFQAVARRRISAAATRADAEMP